MRKWRKNGVSQTRRIPETLENQGLPGIGHVRGSAAIIVSGEKIKVSDHSSII